MQTNTNGRGMNTDSFFGGSGAYKGAGSASWNTEAASAPMDSTDLTIIQDEMHTEALLYKKCAVYADYFTDPKLKNMAQTAAEHHRKHFDTLHGYLESKK